MRNREIILQKIEYWKSVYEKLQNAYIALIDGGVKSYGIDDRQLQRFDLPEIAKRMDEAEQKINEYEALLSGKATRKAVGVVPRDI